MAASVTQLTKEAKAFIAPCYGMKNFSSMTGCRQRVWAQKTGKATAPRLCSLPPTTESFHENVLRAHLQVENWPAAVTGSRMFWIGKR